MTPRESLLGWLDDAATRVGRQRLLHEGVWGLAGLLVLVAGHAIVVRFASAPDVAEALQPLLLLAAISIVTIVVVRRWRRPDLAVVATAVDARLGLHDELRSAHWFMTQAVGSPFVDLHLRHAARITEGLAPRGLFPLRLPRPAAGVAAVALIAGAAAWLLPPRHDPATDGATSISGAVARGAEAHSGSVQAGDAVESERKHGKPGAAATLWQQLAALAGELSGRPEGQSLAQAVAARDARAAAQALRALQQDASRTTTGTSGQETPNEQMSDTLAQGILERIAELMKTGEANAGTRPGEADVERPTARLDRELREDQEDAQRSAPRQLSAGEDALNTSLRALSRSSTGGRDAVHGEADSTEGAGRASVGGGAMGRRVGISGAGAGEGDQPTGTAAAAPEGDSVFGRRTERLAVQLRAVKVPESELDERADHQDPTGTEESFYAATRAQAARAGFESVGAVSRTEAESALAAERSPIEFREAVKRYTLARHRREPDPNRAGGSAR